MYSSFGSQTIDRNGEGHISDILLQSFLFLLRLRQMFLMRNWGSGDFDVALPVLGFFKQENSWQL